MTTIQYTKYLNNPDENFECNTCSKCAVCNRKVATTHHGIKCCTCHKWIHVKCNRLDKNDYGIFPENENLRFDCINCLAEIHPSKT